MARAVSDIWARFATADDPGLLLQLIREFAAFERTPDAVVAIEDDLHPLGLRVRATNQGVPGLWAIRRSGQRCFMPTFQPESADPTSTARIGMSSRRRAIVAPTVG